MRRLAQKIHQDAIPCSGVLVKNKNDYSPRRQQVENRIERTAFGKRAKARALETAGDQIIQPLRLEGPADEMKKAAVLLELADARNGRDLPVSKMPGEQKHSPALVVRLGQYPGVFDANH